MSYLLEKFLLLIDQICYRKNPYIYFLIIVDLFLPQKKKKKKSS